MHIILLSGGSGKRLWPLSNDIRSKQFIKLFRDEDGNYESMVQRVYRQIKSVDPSADITIATSSKQVGSIKNQLEDNVSLCVEPERRDTFPAICLASSYLADVKDIDERETVVVLPVDPYVEYDYFRAIDALCEAHEGGSANLSVMGVVPTYPSEKYGYVVPRTCDDISEVIRFTEKPNEDKAKELIKQNALWNCGIFAFRLGYMLDKADKILGGRSHDHLFRDYSNLKKISIDYALAEHETSIQVLRFSGEWKDVGTWNTFTEVMADRIIGNAEMDDTCENVSIVNELSIPVLAMGMKDCIIAVSNDGILISDREKSSHIKSYVEKYSDEVRFAEKSWGDFTVLDENEGSITIKIQLNKGHQLKYHSHEHRSEVWTVIKGKAEATVNGKTITMAPGDSLHLPIDSKHTIRAISDLEVIEVQTGVIDIADKSIYQLA